MVGAPDGPPTVSDPDRLGNRNRTDGGPTSDGVTPEVSVVVACFNDAARLPVAVRSALEQSVGEIEVIICDDCSTDDTEAVARRLCAADSRLRYLRMAENSGSGAAPRNAGMLAARAPWIIFLDSDDELALGALGLLLEAARGSQADVAAGRISRLHVADDSWSGWCTRLFEEARVTETVREEPDRLYDTAAVGKLYAAGFLERTGLSFMPGLLYEDCLWTAQVYASDARVAVIPDLVYVWKVHESAPRPSVTNERQNLRNVRDRLRANGLIDEWLISHGHGDLLPAKHQKFLRHDLALYLGDLISEEDTWARSVIESFGQYVSQIPRQVIGQLPVLDRLGAQMLERRDLVGVRSVYRAITRGEFATDLVEQDGRLVWSGRMVRAEPTRAAELDVSELHIGRRPFLQVNLAHDLRAWTGTGDGRVEVVIRTWSPMAAIAVPDARVWLELTPRGQVGFTQQFAAQITSVGDSWFESTCLLDERLLDGPPDDDRLNLTVIVQADKLDNVGSVPAPPPHMSLGCSGAWSSPSRGSSPCWVTPVRNVDGTLAARVSTGRSADSGSESVAASWQRLRGPRARTGDAVRKRIRRRVSPPLAVFCAEGGRGYSGNPKYIHQALLETGWAGESIWVRGRGGRGFPVEVQTVSKGSREYYVAMGSAAFWVDDTEVPAHVSKPRGTVYLQARDALQAWGRWAVGPDAAATQPPGGLPSRWDYALAAPEGRAESRRLERRDTRWLLGDLGTPRLDPLVRNAGAEKGPDGLRAVGLAVAPDLGGLDVLFAPLVTPNPGAPGLPWPVTDAAALVADVGRLLFPGRPEDRWRVPGEQSHLLVDVGRVPDWTSAMLASDVLVTTDPRPVREFLLLDRPVILLQLKDSQPVHQGGAHSLALGPVAASRVELGGLLAGLSGSVISYQRARRDLRARWLPAEDGLASARVVDAVFGGG